MTPVFAGLTPLLVAFPLFAHTQTWTDAQGLGSASPQPVSPGGGDGGALITETCPTFSWEAVDGARRYELALCDAQSTPSANTLEQAVLAAPLQKIATDSPATAWTAAGEQCLQHGAGYVWFVRAETADGLGPWSKLSSA